MSDLEAKRWAYSMAAALLTSDMGGQLFEPDDPDEEKKREAMLKVIAELKKRGDDHAR